jgi:uncharacterized protein GlcG (DUF336 family)
MAVVEAAIAAAEDLGIAVTICIADRGGSDVALARLPPTHAGTLAAARGKAHFAATRGRTTENFVEERLRGDDVLWRAVTEDPDTFLVPGGMPLVVDGECVGGIGVSGGKYVDDVKIAEAGIAAFESAVAAGGEA